MSSFRPIGLSHIRPPGTKAWINGQTLTSSGNKDLDGVLGGGICLGSITLLEEDRFSDHVMTLARYFLAQGVSSGQRGLVVGAEGVKVLEKMVSSLPLDLNFLKAYINASTTSSSADGGGGEPFAPPPSALSTVPEDSLNIAWQYRKYMGNGTSQQQQQQQHQEEGKTQGTSASSTYCNSYDLSRSMQKEVLNGSRPTTLDASAVYGEGESQYSKLYDAIAQAIADLPPRTVLRIVIKSFMDGSADWHPDWRQALHFLHSLRALARSGPIVILITTPTHHLPRRTRSLFTRVADTVIDVDSFSSKRQSTPAEFSEFAGLLYIKSLQHINALTHLRGSSNKFGIKRDRRKLHIEPLHLPPEDVRTLTEDVEKIKKKGGVSKMLCSSGPSSRKLDF